MEPIDRHPAGQPGAVAHERLVHPTSRLRSPIVEDRSILLPPPDPERPSLEVPPVGELIRLLAWAIVPAAPFLVLVGWQPALMVGGVALLIRRLSRRAGRATFVFADGFLRFRDDARAQGIQEEDDIRWTWSGGALTGGPEDGARPSWPGSISP